MEVSFSLTCVIRNPCRSGADAKAVQDDQSGIQACRVCFWMVCVFDQGETYMSLR